MRGGKAGYGAEAIEDDIKRRERQQETAIATMKRFRWHRRSGGRYRVMVWDDRR